MEASMADRLNKLYKELNNQKIDGLLVFKPQNRLYLSGFTGSSAVLFITEKHQFLITDFRYIEQAQKQCPEFTIVDFKGTLFDTIKTVVEKTGAKNIGFERDFLTYIQYEVLTKQLSFATLIPTKDIVETLRVIKDQSEILKLNKAVEIADAAYKHILTYIKPGMTEIQVALELEFTMRRQGAEKAAFDIILASGQRSSLPHGVASEKVIEAGDSVTMDFGAVYQGYHSDMTRTIFIGEVTDKQREIYNIVLEAQLTGIKAIAPGKKGKEVDAAARDLIAAKGYGDNFGHGLGHGVGLEIHENPRLSLNSEDNLVSGMAVTVEPGIYLPGWGGVRIEDTTIITAAGCQVLNKTSKELIVV
jgi:Xaa-Pro aminopeptidase